MAGQGIRDDSDHAPPGTTVLAQRIAAILVQHEPGWRLPRTSTLARRFNASPGQIAAAIDELTARHHLRQLPDGQVYRASPAEYLITLDGLAGMGARIDPMGAIVECAFQHSSRRRISEEINHALRLPPGEQVFTIRCLWTADGHNAAISTTYLSEGAGAVPGLERHVTTTLDDVLSTGPPAVPAMAAATWRPTALSIDLQLPLRAAARTLRLAPGQPAISVTVTFEAAYPGPLTAVTAAVLRPDLFRIVLQAAQQAANSGPRCNHDKD